MARPRSFDTNEAVEKAMHVFWTHGYEGASLPDLLEGMGLTRGSLYKAFTDKKSLFLRVLAHYEGQAVEAGVRLLTGDDIPDGRERIMALFAGAYGAAAEGDLRGCLLCSAAAGPSNYDAEIAKVVEGGFRQMRDGLAEAMAASPAHATLDEAGRLALADMLLAQYVGLRTMARARVSLAMLRNTVRSVGLMLDAEVTLDR